MCDAVIVEAVAPEVILTGEMFGDAPRLSDRIGHDAPRAVAASERVASDRQRGAAAPVLDSEDAREGTTAFNERRPPVRPGR
jgi:hypothetical protein